MNDFSFYSPTRFVFGRKATDKVGETLSSSGYRRALIVYGQGSVVRLGTLDRVVTSLDAAGVEHVELGGVRPNPEIGLVREGVELARKHGVDVILPVGGGSAMDCAKAIALGAVYDGDVWDFFRKRATPAARVDIACVVTIPASGSEASNSCVISNDEEHLKCGINTDLNRPVIAILDPELTFTLPAYQTAAGVTDMIAHIMERFFSGEPAVGATDNIACGLVRAAMDGSLDYAGYRHDDVFDVDVPRECLGVPSDLLEPRKTWEDPEAYDEAAAKLAKLFKENFEKRYPGTSLEDLTTLKR